ncbi:MAG TPA: hypothetical protein VK633_13290 [Verrucomicrobiae bacterium]|nr:hypothetical protein [Verrucomicrobiae bacterium]
MKLCCSYLLALRASLVTLLLLQALETYSATTIHLNSSGNDQNDGSSGRPVRSLSRAYDLAGNGDTIQIEAGQYPARMLLTKKITLTSHNGPALLDGGVETLRADAGSDILGKVGAGIQLHGAAFLGGKPLTLRDVDVEWKWRTKPPGTITRAPSWSVFDPVLRFSEPGKGTLELNVTSRSVPKQKATALVNINITGLSVDAGESKKIVLPNNSETACIRLQGKVHYNGQVNPSSGVDYIWFPVPEEMNGNTITGEKTLRPTICIQGSGVFYYKLTATAGGQSESDTVQIEVSRASLSPCSDSLKIVAGPNRGADNPLLLPKASLSAPSPSVIENFTARIEGSGNEPVKWHWTVDNGSIVSESSTARIPFSAVGDYVIRVTADVRQCSVTTNLFVKVIHAAAYYISTDRTPPGKPDFCDHLQNILSWDIKNTHPNCPIQFTWKKLQGPFDRSDFGLGPFTDSLPAGGALSTCAYQIEILSAEFQCDSRGAAIRSEKIEFAFAELNGSIPDALELLVGGEQDQFYWIEASQDLVKWQKITSMRGGPEPLWKRDPNAHEHSSRFYRTVLVDASADSDGDGIRDRIELSYPNILDPLNSIDAAGDADGDGITNSDEINIYHTDPEIGDSDGDGWSDGAELAAQTDPLDAMIRPEVILVAAQIIDVNLPKAGNGSQVFISNPTINIDRVGLFVAQPTVEIIPTLVKP